MIQLENIVTRCAETDSQNSGGAYKLQVTDLSNYNEDGTIEGGSTIYDIAFKEFSGEMNIVSATGRAGDYLRVSFIFTIPRNRFTANLFRSQLRDRRVYAVITDYNEDTYHIIGAKLQSDFTSGKLKSDLNGYTFRLEGVSTQRPYNIFAAVQSLSGDEGTVDGGGFGGEISEEPGPDAPVEACCITILQSVIDYTPTPTGNLANRNRVVTTYLGEKYFIDKLGNAIKLSASVAKERVEGDGSNVYTLSTITDPANTIVNRTQNVLFLADPPSDIDQYNIDEGELHLSPDWPLMAGEYIEIYKIA